MARFSLVLIALLSVNWKYSSKGSNLDPLSECVLRTKNEPYTGTVSVTNNGIPCQAWASSSPHDHNLNQDIYFPNDGSAQAAKNYCRSIKKIEGGYPFCKTANPNVLWGRCALQICNGTSHDSLIVLTDPVGMISSPDRNADGIYDNNVDIMWMIKAETTKVIRYQLMYVDIEPSDVCTRDALLIIDPYYYQTSVSILRICNIMYSFAGASKSNIMIVHFFSNHIKAGTGFQLSYRSMEVSNESCSEFLDAPFGYITSPDRDGDGLYDFNLNCNWTVQVAENHVIGYHVYIDIYYRGFDHCAYGDYMVIADSIGPLSVLCGTGSAPPGETRTNVMFVQFISNNVVSRTGFNMTYVQERKSVFKLVCGGVLRNESGTIVAPDSNSDGRYDDNAYCHWKIVAQQGYVVRYRINYLRIEVGTKDSVTCPIDFLTTAEFSEAEGIQYSGMLHCGYKRENDPFIFDGETKTNILIIEFRSDNSTNDSFYRNHSGFNITYAQRKVTDRYPYFEIQNSSGIIMNLDVDQDGRYDFNTYCIWLITVHPENLIQYQFLFLSLQSLDVMIKDSYMSCKGDYLKVEETGQLVEAVAEIEESYSTSSRLWCGNLSSPELFFTKTNKLRLTFVTDNRYSGRGFGLEFEEKIGTPSSKVLTQNSGWIVAPDENNDGLYDNGLFCSWYIKGQKEDHIKFEILFATLEWSPYCTRDLLQFAFVETNMGYLKGIALMLCGRIQRQAPSLTWGPDLHVTFWTNEAVNYHDGFLIAYERVILDNVTNAYTNAYTDYLMYPPGSITSPDHDENGVYDYHASNIWVIYTHQAKRILIEILFIDIESSLFCDHDRLSIRDTDVLYNLCGIGIKTVLISNSAEWIVYFYSDYTINKSGFELTFVTIEDEKFCHSVYKCLHSDITVVSTFLCDSYNDCPYGDDERFCDFRCPAECVCYGLKVDCSRGNACQPREKTTNKTGVLAIPSSSRGLDISGNGRLYDHITLKNLELPFLFNLNLSVCDIDEFPQNMFYSMRELRTLDISYNKISRLTSNMFVYQTNLKTFIFVGNMKPLVFEPESFNGLSSLKYLKLSGLYIKHVSRDTFANLKLDELSISYSTIDVMGINSLGSLQTKAVYFNTTQIKTLTQSMFDGAQTLELLKTDEYKFCCVKPLGVSDDNCFPKNDEISSCDDLIRNEILVPLIWLIGFFSVFANMTSLVFRFTRQRKQLKRNYGIFVSHLAVSDSLMGFYLLIIAAADIHYRGVYIYNDEFWRESILCQFAGVLSLVSSETSVLLICLITLDRFLVVKYPLGQVKIDTKTGKKLAFIVWSIVLFLAILPVTTNPIFEGKFFSASGVCLALPLTRARPSGWIYSFIISVGFNFVACILVASGQWMIHKEIKHSEAKMRDRRSTTRSDTHITRNLLVVAVTNVLCWLPICILGIMALAGSAIRGEVYSWVAVVILPITSSVNPLIYTLLAALQKKKDVQIPETDEGETNVILTSDDVEKHTCNWTSRVFWQCPSQSDGFSVLSSVLEGDDLSLEQRLVFARNVATLIHQLHDKMLFQQDLKLDDIFIDEGKPGDNMRIILRPKFSQKKDDILENIRTLGLILEKILKTEHK